MALGSSGFLWSRQLRVTQFGKTRTYQEGEKASQKSPVERQRCVGRSGVFLLRDCNMISAMAANGALRCPDIICCSSSLQGSADPSLLFSLDRNINKKLTSWTFMQERVNPSRMPQEVTKKVHTAATPSTLSFKWLRESFLQQNKVQQKLSNMEVSRLRRKSINTAETNPYSNQQY